MNTTIKAIALVAVIAAAAVALSADGSDAVTYTDDSGIIYEASGTTATVIGWEGASSELTIPSKITVDGKDYNVTKIGDRAFYDQDIRTIVLPDTLRTLGSDAFSCNDAVETVEIPGSVDSYAHSFSGCSSLKEIKVATTNDTFESVSGVLMNEKKDTIYQYPAGKTTYTIPDTVKTIGAFAFSGCTLERITIPASVTDIGDGAFSYCDSLTTFNAGNSKNYVADGGVLFTKDKKELVAYPNGKAGEEYTVPNNVGTISAYAFAGSPLKSVTLPSSVRTIGAYAFTGSALTEIELNQGANSVGQGAFEGCTALTKATLPSSLTRLGQSMFMGCTSLQEVSWAATTSSATIGISAFEGCTSLIIVQVPERTTTIDDRAFTGCTSLTSFTIPDSVTTIGDNAFMGSGLTEVTVTECRNMGTGIFQDCTSLKEVTLEADVDSIPEDMFAGCGSIASFAVAEDSRHYSAVGGNLYSKDLKTLVRYAPASTASEFSVPEGTATISEGAFEGAVSLVTVRIPATVTSIGAHAFLGCSGLEQAVIASETLSVGEGAFDLSAGEPVTLEIFTDAAQFPESAFGFGTTPVYDAFENFGVPHSEEIMGDALTWVVIAIVLGVIFLVVSIASVRS